MQIQELIRGAKNAVSLAQVCFPSSNVLFSSLILICAMIMGTLRNENRNSNDLAFHCEAVVFGFGLNIIYLLLL